MEFKENFQGKKRRKNMSFIVAMDGPAGAGKGTITKQVAEKLGLINIDTGAMFRLVTLNVIQEGIEIHEEDRIKSTLI